MPAEKQTLNHENYYTTGFWRKAPGAQRERWISGTNPTLEEIMKIGMEKGGEYFSIYNESTGKICLWSPPNFLAALATMLHHQEFMDIFEQNNVEVPLSLVRPASIIQDVPLYIRVDDYGRPNCYKPLQLTAPQVLVKYCVGSVVGLVLEGPLTGVILEKIKSKHWYFSNFGNELCINRLWNDLPFTKEYVPDEPDWGGDLNCRRVAQKLFQQIYSSYSANHDWQSEALFALVDDINVQGKWHLPLQKTQFNCTRGLNDTKNYFKKRGRART